MRKGNRVMVACLGIGLFVFIQLCASFVNAEYTIREYKVMKRTEIFKEYITGVGRGIYWTNMQLQQTANPPLYCQPMKLSLSADNYLDIIDRYIAENKDKIKPESFIEVILLKGMIDTFPCTK
jgi:hypothetical protein